MWIINIIGFSLIATIIWWFWLYKPEEQANNYTSADMDKDGTPSRKPKSAQGSKKPNSDY